MLRETKLMEMSTLCVFILFLYLFFSLIDAFRRCISIWWAFVYKNNAKRNDHHSWAINHFHWKTHWKWCIKNQTKNSENLFTDNAKKARVKNVSRTNDQNFFNKKMFSFCSYGDLKKNYNTWNQCWIQWRRHNLSLRDIITRTKICVEWKMSEKLKLED